MTSINAMRFNEYEGAMVCDEQRGWNEENMKCLLSDKIKSVIPLEMTKQLGVVAAYGNTGTSSIGDELRIVIKERIEEEFEKNMGKPKKVLQKLFTIDYIAELTYESIVNMKHRHINEELQSKFGFNTMDLIRGFYVKNGKKIEIKDKDIKAEAFELVTWNKKGKSAQSVFLNSGIIAGFSPVSGFKIFHLDIMSAYYQQVGEVFLANGSGTMGATPVFSELINNIDVNDRYDIDRIEGIFTIIDAVNEAKRKNLGVGGYFNILIFNGKEKNDEKKLMQFPDHRSKLATEIVECVRFNYLKRKTGLELLDLLLYKEKSFVEVYNLFMKSVDSKDEVNKFLRGYREKKNL